MGNFLKKFNKSKEKVKTNLEEHSIRPFNEKPRNTGRFNRKERNTELDEDYDEFYKDEDYDNDVGIQPSQKPESFFHFILENQYKDLERSIRGFKDVYDKKTGKWEVRRKDLHCFTDEESEEILRAAQSHLATDIKLGFVSLESFPILMDAIYKQFSFLFSRISEYRYGRYGGYEIQGKMKEQNLKIFLELFARIQANYSRSIQGKENQQTHNSVKGQESLQSTERMEDNKKGYY